MKILIRHSCLFTFAATLGLPLFAAPLGTAFTYHGRLAEGGNPANGIYDLWCTVYDVAAGGSIVAGGSVTNSAVPVSNGLFTLTLDFGSVAFNGDARWLGIAVRTNGGSTFTTLSPRQPLTPTPYALYATVAGAAQTVWANGVASASLQANAITTDKVSDNSITAAKLASEAASLNKVSGGTLTASSGRVGVGTATPGEKLDVASGNLLVRGPSNFAPGTDARLNLGDGNNYVRAVWGEGLRLGVWDGLDALAVNNGGNVGIGLTNPASKLHVAGTVSATGFSGSGAGLTGLNGGALAGGSVGQTALSADAVTSAKIADGTITDLDVNGATGISASKIIGGDLRADRLKVGANHTLSGNWATIAGGSNHTASAQYASIGGGYRNSATGQASRVGGGAANTAGATDAAVGGGESNTANGTAATVGGGLANLAGSPGAFVGGGGWNGLAAGGNVSTGVCASVVGGYRNVAGEAFAIVGGGENNRATGDATTVGGGRNNVASASGDTVGGGTQNVASGGASTVGGGLNNQATGSGSVVVGGGYYDVFSGPLGNLASGFLSAVVGGTRNKATAEAAFVGGGSGNVATNSFAVVAGGIQNEARGYASFIGGGGAWGSSGNYIFEGNVASGVSSVVVGGYGNLAGNLFSTIPGGRYNLAEGAYSFAAGCRAKAHGNGSFVWGDANDFDVHAWGANQFVIRATGGYWFFSGVDGSGNPTAGATLAAGSGSWGSWSDRNAKTNCIPVDSAAVLEQVLALPIASWNYITQDPSVRHLGPMAQDFHAAFGVGDSDRTITTVDADGVALAAIQGLNQKLEAENAELKRRLDRMEQLVQQLTK